MSKKQLNNRLAQIRSSRNWSQQELADRTGLSRAEISAIEIGRVVPSTAAALEIAAAFGIQIEDVFSFAKSESTAAARWMTEAPSSGCGIWGADVFGNLILYPEENTHVGQIAHDAHWDGVDMPAIPDAKNTLVMAGCDPAASILAHELQRERQTRLITLIRSSGAALALLKDRHIHIAGVHSGEEGGSNERLAQRVLGPEFVLLRFSEWEEGIALDPAANAKSVRQTVRSNLRWVNRDENSGARKCLDALLGEGRPRPRGYQRVVGDHRSVAATIQSGWAQAGICIRLVAEQFHLGFLSIQREPYDLCFHRELLDEPRLTALIHVLRSTRVRETVAQLPGYWAESTGEIVRA